MAATPSRDTAATVRHAAVELEQIFHTHAVSSSAARGATGASG